MTISSQDFFNRVHGHFNFLTDRLGFEESTGSCGEEPNAFVKYSIENLTIWIIYGCPEFRPELTFVIYGENCLYSDFFRLDEFDEKFFDEYKGFGKFKDTVEYDLTYLEVFLKKYLPCIIKNLPEIYSRLRANGHIGFDGVVRPFKIDEKKKWWKIDC